MMQSSELTLGVNKCGRQHYGIRQFFFVKIFQIPIRQNFVPYGMYCSKGEGEVYILTYKTNARSFASISKLRSSFTWLDYFALHHVN